MKRKFEEKDLVSFGNYLLSDERKTIFKKHPTDLSLEERLSNVHDPDLANWKDKL